MSGEVLQSTGHEGNQLQRPGRIRRIASKAGNLLRIGFGDFVNWSKVQEARTADWTERQEWLKHRIDELVNTFGTAYPSSAFELAYERAHLEIFCDKKELLPGNGLEEIKMRWLGFKLDTRTIDNRPGRESYPVVVSAIFPDGWDMRPTHPEDDPTGTKHAVITDPDGNVRFGVMYKEAAYERKAWIHEVNQSVNPVQSTGSSPVA